MNPRIVKLTDATRLKRAVLLLPICTVVLLQGCGGAPKEQETVVAVHTTPAKRGPIELTVSAEAVVYPLEQAVITPKITSTVSKFYVQRGSRVKMGQVLAQLESADLVGAAEQSKGDFEQAEASYATTTGANLPQQIQKAELDAAAAKAAFDAQQKVYDSRKDLFEQGAIPRRDLDTAEVMLIQARSQNEQTQKQLSDLKRLGKEQALKSASGQLSSAKGKYENAKALLSYTEIRSPIDGVVTDRPLYQGELATANQPILTVMNTSKLIAKAHLPQNEAVLLKAGDPAELKIPAAEEPIPGRVMLVSPALDPGSTTIEVWVEALKSNSALKPGMSVQIEATAKSVQDALTVPSGAVFNSPEAGEYVLIAGKDEKAHLSKVKVGIRNRGLAEIQSGIKENDPVITAGGYALPDGTKIKVEAASPTEPEKDKDAADTGDKAEAAPEKKAGAPVDPPRDKE
jgi:HlyD family secretion protein